MIHLAVAFGSIVIIYNVDVTFTSYHNFSHSAVDQHRFFYFLLPKSHWIMNNLIWQTLIEVDVQQTLQNNVVIKPMLCMLWYSIQEFAAVKSHLLIFNNIFPLVVRFDLKSKLFGFASISHELNKMT